MGTSINYVHIRGVGGGHGPHEIEEKEKGVACEFDRIKQF